MCMAVVAPRKACPELVDRRGSKLAHETVDSRRLMGMIGKAYHAIERKTERGEDSRRDEFGARHGAVDTLSLPAASACSGLN